MRSALAPLAPLTRLRPGWYLLAALVVYALVVTVQWRAAAAELRDVRMTEAGAASAEPVERTASTRAPAAETGLWFPVPGARIPSDDDHLPGAARDYRAGVAEGFTFRPESSGVPIVHGTPVIAAGSGEVIRVDTGYVEPSPAEWEALLARVEGGADDADLDLLRGRQVWLRLDDGRVLRYGHLASIRSGLSVGQSVARGRVIGTVGNSGTPDGVAGRPGNARLHFELRDGDSYFGAGLDPDEVRLAATSLFTGP
jgi:peptidoglycan LD-endopeptidase LytH